MVGCHLPTLSFAALFLRRFAVGCGASAPVAGAVPTKPLAADPVKVVKELQADGKPVVAYTVKSVEDKAKGGECNRCLHVLHVCCTRRSSRAPPRHPARCAQPLTPPARSGS